MNSLSQPFFSIEPLPLGLKEKANRQLERKLPYALIHRSESDKDPTLGAFQDAKSFLDQKEKEAQDNGILFFPKSIYSNLNHRLILIFGQEPSDTRSVFFKQLKPFDRFGDLLREILRVNTSWRYANVALQAFAIISVCLYAGYFSKIGDTIFLRLLNLLPQTIRLRMTALRL